MSKRIYRLVTLLLGGIFGFAGCFPVAEYGMPHAEYNVDGVVVTKSDQTPIPGIQLYLGSSQDGQISGFVLSDASGNWIIEETAFPCANNCELQVDDIDGSSNLGIFASKTVALTLKKTGNGSGSWDEGTFEQHGIQVELDPKE